MKAVNYKKEYERLLEENESLKAQNEKLRMAMRSKESIIKNIIKKIDIKPPYDTFIDSLRRMNYDDLWILEENI